MFFGFFDGISRKKVARTHMHRESKKRGANILSNSYQERESREREQCVCMKPRVRVREPELLITAVDAETAAATPVTVCVHLKEIAAHLSLYLFSLFTAQLVHVRVKARYCVCVCLSARMCV